MHSRLYQGIALLSAVALTSGCVQATRHSNTMVFGTNTTFGIKAGASTGEVPEIVVGYDRQEAVIMPLLANTRDDSKAPNNRLKPCDVTEGVRVVGSTYAVHPCSFVAFKGGAQDSYSVLASFGAEFSAKANTNPEASGGLAQYFATGMAAQILAAKGGAALVSTSKAASDSGSSDVDLKSLFPVDSTTAVATAKLVDKNVADLRTLIEGTSAADLPQKMTGFENSLGLDFSLNLPNRCTSQAACLNAVNGSMATIDASGNFKAAIQNWASY